MNNLKKRGLAVIVLTAMLCLMMGNLTLVSASNDSFYKDLSKLIKSQDSSSYFGTLNIDADEFAGSNSGDGAAGDPVKNVLTIIADAAGAKVSDKSGELVIKGRSGESITYNKNGMTIDGEAVSGDGATRENAGAYYAASLANALDMRMEWSEDGSYVTLSAPYQTARILAWAKKLDTSGLNATKTLNNGDLWVLQFATPADARNAQLKLEARGVFAEPDYFIPNDDPENWNATSADGIGKVSASGEYNSWGVEDCCFPEFIDRYADQMQKEEIVAVVDSGVDADHPFLRGRVLDGRDFVDGDDDPYDENRHGTHVAGIVIDCAGDAPIKILPVRVMDANGRGYNSTIATGIEYAAEQGADVINLSLGGERNENNILEKMIMRAVEQGVVVAIAAGNYSVDTDEYSPAYISTEGVVVVSAGDDSHMPADFTNYGQSVDVMAPGVKVLSCIPNNDYLELKGTSMATPHVSAALALLDAATGKRLSPEALEELLYTATTNGVWTDEYYGGGFLDMSNAGIPGGKNPTPPKDSKPPEEDPEPIEEDPEPSGKRVIRLPFTDRDDIEYKVAVSELIRWNVINGFEDGTFRPYENLTRGQACKILTLLYDLEPTGKRVHFDDVDGHWAEDYILCCASLDIVSGYGNGEFGPEDVLTGDAWEKMLLCVMGFDAEADGMIGDGWADGVDALSEMVGLEDGISQSYKSGAPISRDEACQLAYNSF